jgi:hypothetical protein
VNIDPNEEVSLGSLQGGLLTLRKAVKKIMAMPPLDQSAVEVYRKDQPDILTIKEIRELAMRPEFQSDDED